MPTLKYRFYGSEGQAAAAMPCQIDGGVLENRVRDGSVKHLQIAGRSWRIESRRGASQPKSADSLCRTLVSDGM